MICCGTDRVSNPNDTNRFIHHRNGLHDSNGQWERRAKRRFPANLVRWDRNAGIIVKDLEPANLINYSAEKLSLMVMI
jgi:hypothetical protein